MSAEASSSGFSLVRDAAVAANNLDVGIAPGFALAQAYVSTVHALSLQALAQQHAQQQAAIVTQAVVSTAAAQLLSLEPAEIAAQS